MTSATVTNMEDYKTRRDNMIPRPDPVRTDTAIPQSLLDNLFDSEEFKRRLEAMIEEIIYKPHIKGLPGDLTGVDDAFEEVIYLGEPDVVPQEAARDIKKAYEIEDLSHLVSFDTYWDE